MPANDLFGLGLAWCCHPKKKKSGRGRELGEGELTE